MAHTYIHEKMLNINSHQENAKAAMRYRNTPIKISKIKDVGLELSSVAGGNVKLCNNSGKQIGRFLKVKHPPIRRSSLSTPRYVPKGKGNMFHISTYSQKLHL